MHRTSQTGFAPAHSVLRNTAVAAGKKFVEMGLPSVGTTTGNALVAAIAGLTESSENKLRDVSRKATLARLLDDRSGSGSSTNSDGGGRTIDKENSSRSSTVSRGLASSSPNAVFSERGNCNNNNITTGAAAVIQTNHGNLEALRNLRDLSSIVSEVERRVAVLREAIDNRRRDNAARREMSDTARQQTAQLAGTLAALPEHLPHAAPNTTETTTSCKAAAATAVAAAAAGAPAAAVSGPRSTRSGANRRRGEVATAAVGPAGGGEIAAGRVSASDVSAVPVLELVTVAELNGVPRSTRARLTIEQINAAVSEIQKAVEKRCVWFWYV